MDPQLRPVAILSVSFSKRMKNWTGAGAETATAGKRAKFSVEARDTQVFPVPHFEGDSELLVLDTAIATTLGCVTCAALRYLKDRNSRYFKTEQLGMHPR